jgi:hypothetical protein
VANTCLEPAEPAPRRLSFEIIECAEFLELTGGTRYRWPRRANCQAQRSGELRHSSPMIS